MKTLSVRSRHRLLLTNVLALALALGALAYAPPVLAWQCDGGCVNWNAEQGCIEYQDCCVWDDGSYTCWINGKQV